jgi:hypothetical protein
MKQEKINTAFLRSKFFSGFNVWAQSEVTWTSQSGNIHRLSEDVFTFTHYNLLPSCEGDILDGHYTIFVNKNNFEYLLYKSSDYGSLTYVIPCEFGGAFLTEKTLPEPSKQRIESIIAHKLLSAYFYDGKHVNQQGANLFPSTTEDDYDRKGCLICDYRGYIWSGMKPEQYGKEQLAALKILINFEPANIPEFEPEFVKQFTSKFKRKKGVEQLHSLNINGVEYTVAHMINEIYGKQTALLDADKKMIAHEHLDGSLTKFVKQVPTILKNFAK